MSARDAARQAVYVAASAARGDSRNASRAALWASNNARRATARVKEKANE